MNPPTDPLAFSLPLTLQHHRIALQFHNRHANSEKAKQVYLNTLGVQAVSVYLRCMGIDADLEGSESWNPTLQALADIADLSLNNRRRLECRPLLPGEGACWIPPEVRSDRIGYVVVRFNPDLTEAMLLGFVPAVDREELPLGQLQPLDRLLACLATGESAAEPTVVSQWLQGRFAAGWDTITTLLERPELAYQFRTARFVPAGAASQAAGGVKRAKRLHLGAQQGEVALVVGVASGTLLNMEVTVELYPLQERRYLPATLQLQVLDGSDRVVLQAEAGSSEGLEFQFRGEPGEPFSVRVALGEFSFTEGFQI